MKKEETKNRKKLSVLLIAILAVLLIGVLVAVGFITGLIPTGGNADNSTLYWNIDKEQYLSSAGLSSRVPGEDGYYKVRMAVDGEQKEYLVQDKTLVDAIDNMDLMGLVVDKKGVIAEVLDPSQVTGGEMINKWYVISADSEKVVVGDELSGEGLTYNVNISEDTGIYDVSGVEPVGQSTTLEKGDCVRVFKGKVEGISYIFVVEDDRVTFKGETVEKYCEHCETTVTWNVWTETEMLPTEKGHWMLANDASLNGVQKIETNVEVVVDLNGQKVDGRLNTQVYHVTNNGATLVIMDQSEGKTGTIAAHGYVKTGGIVNLQQGFMKIYGGTFDASDVDTDFYGCALRLQSQTETNIYGGTIIGGVSRRVKTGSGSMSGGAGGSIFVDKNAIVNMYDGTIKGGKVYTYQDPKNKSYSYGIGGNIYLATYATFHVYGGEILDGWAERDGGNIYAMNGVTFSIANATISGGKAEQNRGGNVFIGNETDVEIKNSKITNGTAVHGGNVAIWSKGKLTMTDCTVTGGTATVRGGNIVGIADMTFNNCKISGGKTIHKKPDVNNGIGGNICALGYSQTVDGVKKYEKLTVTLKNTTVKGGESNGNGGNINLKEYVNLVIDKTVTIADGTSKQGGNIYVSTNSNITMSGGLIENGKATGHGGNVYIFRNSIFKMSGGTIKNGTSDQGGNIVMWGLSTLEISGGTISGGTAVLRGGNIVCLGDLKMTGGTITGGKVEHEKPNNERGIGGNIYFAGYTDTTVKEKPSYKSSLTMTGGTISGGESVTSRGGNIYIKEMANVTIGDKAVIKDGVAKVNGGNIMSQKSSVTITVNKGAVIKDGTAGSCGGNLFNNGAIITLNDVDITGGTAGTTGGNIQNLNAPLTLNNVNVISGTAKSGSNIYVEGKTGVLTMNGGTMTDGKGATHGGNLYASNNSKAVINNAKIIDGVATKRGGNIYAGGGSVLKLTGTTEISGGKASERAGNILSYGDLTIKDKAVVTDGEADGKDSLGGNIYIADYTQTKKDENGKDVTEVVHESKMIIDGGTITNGKAVNGGNIWANATTNIKDVFIADGEATTNGGNFYMNGGKITVAGGTITSGKAANSGGNICALSASIINVDGGVIEAGEAKQGGNVHLERHGQMTMTGGEIKDGKVSNRGGNVVVWGLAKFTMTGGTITNGEAKNMGGNVFSFGDLEIKGGTITGGKVTAAKSTGGNIYITSFNNTQVKPAETVKTSITMTGGKIALGEAVNGGNIWANATVTISGGEVSEGKATAQDDTEATGCGGNIFMNGGALTVSGEAKVKKGVATSVAEAVSKETVKGEDGKDVTINHGYRTGAGGNIYSAVNVTVKDGAEVTDGTTVSVVKNNNCGIGGNIFMYGTSSKRVTLTVAGGTVSNGEAYNRGGNINMYAYGDLIVKGKMDADDKVIAGENGKDGLVSDGKLTAGGNGGNIFVQTAGTITVGNRGVVSGGLTSGDGGNIMFNASGKTITVEAGGQIVGGQAKRGGNIYIVAGNLMVNGGTIKDGKAVATDNKNLGGNIYSEKANNQITVQNGGLIKDGEAYNGGNIYAADKAVIQLLSNAVVEGGYASYRGGSMYLKKSELTLTNATVKDGEAANNGGNIVAEDSGMLVTLNDGAIISGGKSGGNGGNMTFATGTLTINKGAQIINGSGKGGNVYLYQSAAAFNISGGTITGGTLKDGTTASNIMIQKVKDLDLKFADSIAEGDLVIGGISYDSGTTGSFATNAKAEYVNYMGVAEEGSDYEITYADGKLSISKK